MIKRIMNVSLDPQSTYSIITETAASFIVMLSLIPSSFEEKN